MTKYFSIYRVRVQYGRGEMFSVFLVAANSPIKAKDLRGWQHHCQHLWHVLNATLLLELYLHQRLNTHE